MPCHEIIIMRISALIYIFCRFERSKLDEKYSLIVSVCMHALIVGVACSAGHRVSSEARGRWDIAYQ